MLVKFPLYDMGFLSEKKLKKKKKTNEKGSTVLQLRQLKYYILLVVELYEVHYMNCLCRKLENGYQW